MHLRGARGIASSARQLTAGDGCSRYEKDTMAHDIVLKDGLLVTPSGVIRGGVAIDGERIVGVGSDTELGPARREIGLDGRVVLPGLFDPHIHFGLGDKIGYDSMEADFQYDSKDCLIGGVTTVATTTLISREPLNQLFDETLRRGTSRSWCDFKITSVVNTLEQAKEITSIVKKGGVSFKFFTGYVGAQAEGFGMNKEGITPDLFYQACKAISESGPPAFAAIHAEDPYVRGILVDQLRNMGRTDYLTAWAESSPEWAESVQIYTYGLIANQWRVPLYPVHISSAHTVATVRELQRQGLPIIAETISSFLSATAPEMDARGMKGKAKVQPPMRFERDRDALWRGIVDGVVSVVGTDSLTYSTQFKEGADFWDCRVGVNLQVADTLALLFDEGINRRRLDLATLTRVLSENPAKIYGVYPKKGALSVGADADLVVVDPDKEVILGRHRYRSRSDYSLWEGRRVRGVPVMTLLRGQVVMESGEIVVDKPFGRHVDEIITPTGPVRPSRLL